MPAPDDLEYPEQNQIQTALLEILPAWTRFTVECFGGFCPVQGSGKIDDQSWYFRARGEHWSLTIGKEDDSISGYVDDKDAIFDIVGPCNVLELFAAGYMNQIEIIEHMTYALGMYLSGERGEIRLPDPSGLPTWERDGEAFMARTDEDTDEK